MLLGNPKLSGMAQGLLAASGPSTTPVSFGQAWGMGLQSRQQQQELQRRQQMEALRMQALQQQMAQAKQQQEAQARLAEGFQSGNFADPASRAQFAGLLANAGQVGAAVDFMQGPQQDLPEFVRTADILGIPRDQAAKMWYQKQVKPLASQNVNVDSGPKLPNGYMWKDPSNPTSGVVPIPGGPVEKEAAETASKRAMIDVAANFLPTIDNLLFEGGDVSKGGINRPALGQAAVSDYVPGVLIPDGDQLANAYEFGIQGITRTETGAAMPPGEVSNTRKRFQPKFTDSDRVIRQKRIAYELFLKNTTKYLDPNAPKTGNWRVDVDQAMRDAEAMLEKQNSGGWSIQRVD